MITGFSNAVNLTDGLDGLAAGCMAIVSFVFLVLALIVGIPQLGRLPAAADRRRRSGQMAVLAGAMIGACLGFLWFNCNPASVFMGDTGSLALGGLIGYIAIVIRQELMLLLVGGIFVAEAVSRDAPGRLLQVHAHALRRRPPRSSSWPRSTTTSSARAGRRRRSSSASG